LAVTGGTADTDSLTVLDLSEVERTFATEQATSRDSASDAADWLQ